MEHNEADLVVCPGCGARVENYNGPTHSYIGANAGCWRYYGQILAREYEDARYFRNHRLTVDTYAIQHPGHPERKSIQSVNAHLISLALIFERNVTLEDATKALGHLIEKYHSHFQWLKPPTEKYQLTVQDILDSKGAEEHCEKVKEWAFHTWQRWEQHHPSIRKYL